jgi:hypothetical protein
LLFNAERNQPSFRAALLAAKGEKSRTAFRLCALADAKLLCAAMAAAPGLKTQVALS